MQFIFTIRTNINFTWFLANIDFTKDKPRKLQKAFFSYINITGKAAIVNNNKLFED